jgi:hypothetical protein
VGRAHPRGTRAVIGISGYDYKGWRGRFYPDDVPAVCRVGAFLSVLSD